jgi:sec-independent protein translocase protein TatB
MFDVAFSELLIAAVIALIVIGPERLPRVARQAGEWLGKIQRYINDVKSDVGRQMEIEELRRMQTEITEVAHDLKKSVEKGAAEVQQEVDSLNAAVEGEPAAEYQPTDWNTVYAVRQTRDRLRERREARDAELGRKRRKLPQRQAHL